jgi:hypothetical protein
MGETPKGECAMKNVNPANIRQAISDEAGHAYAYGGGGLVALILLIILLIWLF